MIPIRLTLEGLYSYRERQTVDFTRLTESHLFGIFGATGSGKSSVLEAISFALYGETERLSGKERRNYNMMNLRANQLYIAFEFDAEGVPYRFEVQGKRNSKRHEDVGTMDRRAYRYEGGEWQPLPEASAEPIIGLSYENFCRTIIIPQGKFQAFLELTETARTRMLMDIFGLDRFELAEKAIGLDRQNQRLLDQAEAGVQQYADTSQEAIVSLAEQLTALMAALSAAQDRRRALTVAVARSEEARKKQEQARKLADELRLLEQELPEIHRREQRLETYESVLRDFKPLFDQRAALLKRLDQLRQDKDRQQSLLQEGEQKFEKARHVFLTAEKEFLQRDLLKQEAEEYDLACDLRKKQENLLVLQGRIEKGASMEADTQLRIHERKQEIDALDGLQKDLRNRLPDVRELSEVKAWFDRLEALKKEEALREADLRASAKEWEDQLALRETGLREAGVPAAQALLPGEVVWATVEKMAAAARSAEAHAEREAEKALLFEHVGALADALRPGDPCPLCGATDHPHPATAAGLVAAQKSFMTSRDLARADRQKLDLTLAQLREWLAHEKMLEKRKAELENRLQTAQASLLQHRAAFVWTRYASDDSQQVEAQFAEMARFQAEITRADEALDHARRQLEKEQAELSKYQSGLLKLREDHAALRAMILTEQKRFRILTPVLLESLPPAQLEALAREKLTAFSNVEKLYQTARDHLHGIESSNNQLKGSLAQLDSSQKKTQREFDQLRQTIEIEVAQSGLGNVEAVRDILAEAVDVISEKKALEGFRIRIQALARQAEEAQKAAGEAPFDEAQFTQQQEALATNEAHIQEKERETGAAQASLTRMENRWEEKKLLLTAYAKLKTRAENLRTMKNLFKGSGFVNYVSTMFLDQLCLAANDRFRRLTRNTLEIRTGANNSLQVCDWLNGGKERSVKTLSGGQAFQAALSLALALADQVQYQARSKQNFFFLDEGFGSQDKNSLAVVMDTLKSLRKENRVVGVISHVEEMQQEITSHIQITLDPERGSVVRPSWE